MKRIRRVIVILTIFLQVSFLGIRGVSGGEELADTELYAKAACLLDGDSAFAHGQYYKNYDLYPGIGIGYRG